MSPAVIANPAHRETFHALVSPDAQLRQLFTGAQWAEGPLYLAAEQTVLFSDIPGNRILAHDLRTGQTRTHLSPSNYANGRALDDQGRIVTCEHLGRRVTRTEPDGSTSVLADRFEGRRLNSPNDVVVARDASIWFTDPTYGIDSDYEGAKSPSELPTAVYRIKTDGQLTCENTELTMPNGLAFTLDQRALHVVDSGDGPGVIHRFQLTSEGHLGDREVFATIPDGHADGIRIDARGNLWAAVHGSDEDAGSVGSDAVNSVRVFDGTGSELGRIPLPERASNLCFGGADQTTLFITAGTSLYAIDLLVTGA